MQLTGTSKYRRSFSRISKQEQLAALFTALFPRTRCNRGQPRPSASTKRETLLGSG